YRLARKGR
ncbi:hypothetical protein AB1N83_001020, partial [Pleurotus pulmonarius]